MGTIEDNLESAFSYGRRMYWRGIRVGVFWTAVASAALFIAGFGTARADGLYLSGDVSLADRGEYRDTVVATYAEPKKCIHWQDYICSQGIGSVTYRSDKPDPPYVKVELGYDWDITDWITWKVLAVSHESSTSTGRDIGFNKVTSGVRVNLWRRK